MSANVQTMMYVGEKPWHELGKKLEKEATSAEALVASGLDWRVEKQPIYTNTMNGTVMLDRHFANVRQDTQEVLGVVGSDYCILQNKDAFRFCDALVGEAAAMYHTAGALGNGEIIWILAKLPKHIKIKNKDDIENFLLFSHRHDGKQRVRVMFTPIRVVCQNTLNQAISGNNNTAFIQHRSGMGLKLQQVRDQIGIVYKQMDMFEELSNKMAEKQIKVSEFKDYLGKLNLATDAEMKEQQMLRRMIVEEELSALFEFGPGAQYNSAKGTVWGAYNAVTRYVDFDKPVKSKDPSYRATSLLYGSGALLKHRAWQEAVNLIK